MGKNTLIADSKLEIGEVFEITNKDKPKWCEGKFRVVKKIANGYAVEREMTEDPLLRITDVDYFENDAILHVGDKSYVFCFSEEPTVVEALAYLSRQGIQI